MKLSIKVTCLILPLLILIADGCVKKKLTPRDYPRVETLEVTDRSSSGVQFNADIFYNKGWEIIDHGFVWGEKSPPSSGPNYNHVSLGKYDGKGDFSWNASSGLHPDITLYVRAYLVTEENSYFGNTVPFNSLGCDPPIITAYEPVSACFFDTITINGTNFSNSITGNVVYFGEIIARRIVSATNTQIKVIVPHTLMSETSVLSVTTSGHMVNASPEFTLIFPEFYDFTPKIASLGEIITITGNNISPYLLGSIEVWFGAKKGVIKSVTRTEIEVEVPRNIDSASEPLKVVALPTVKIFDENFQVAPPIVTSFSPASGGPNTSITVLGIGFHQLLAYNSVTMGGITVSPTSVFSSVIVFVPPAGLTTGNYKIYVTTLGMTSESEEYFSFTAPGK